MERSVQIESGRPRDHEAVNGDGGKTGKECIKLWGIPQDDLLPIAYDYGI